MTIVDVVIPCGTNCEGYVEFLIWSIEQTAKNPERFRYILGINNDGVDAKRLGKLGEVVDARSGLGYSSKSHGITLDKTFEHVTSEYALILDCDVAFLLKDWDFDFLHLMGTGVDIMGTVYPEDYEKVGAHPKYAKWPNAICCMVNVEKFRELDVSFCPGSPVKLDETNAHLYGLKPGKTVTRDTGYQLSSKFRAVGSTAVPFPIYRKADPESQFLQGCRGDEYHFTGRPIVSHMGRSSLRIFGAHPIAVTWEKRVRDWIAENV